MVTTPGDLQNVAPTQLRPTRLWRWEYILLSLKMMRGSYSMVNRESSAGCKCKTKWERKDRHFTRVQRADIDERQGWTCYWKTIDTTIITAYYANKNFNLIKGPTNDTATFILEMHSSTDCKDRWWIFKISSRAAIPTSLKECQKVCDATRSQLTLGVAVCRKNVPRYE